MNTPKNAKGEVIRALRKAAGVRQKDLAQVAGISPSHLQRVETSERDTSQRALSAIAACLGVDKALISRQQQDEVAA